MTRTSMPARRFVLAMSLVMGALAALPAGAQEITLRAANAFQEGTYYARNFERFVKKVNDEGKGIVQINYVGGPKAIPTFELANALRGGVVDLANTTTSFTTSIVPEGMAMNYTHMTMAEMRRNGTFDYLNKLFQDKGLFYFARTGEGIQYYIYTNRKIDKADLTGVKLRSAPIYREFFQKLGATPVQIAPGEVYTALERGVVDGFGWPLIGIFDLGWQDKVKYRVEPGFYTIELGVVFNFNTWRKLTAQQRQFLEKQGAWLEGLNVEMAAKDAQAEIKRQQDAKIQVIRLDDAQAKVLVKTANDAAWNAIVASSPIHGPKLREMMAPK
ncbi:MAG: TRAP transporter substrate-binding protein DctP [Burkholderiales bacterium]